MRFIPCIMRMRTRAIDERWGLKRGLCIYTVPVTIPSDKDTPVARLCFYDFRHYILTQAIILSHGLHSSFAFARAHEQTVATRFFTKTLVRMSVPFKISLTERRDGKSSIVRWWWHYRLHPTYDFMSISLLLPNSLLSYICLLWYGIACIIISNSTLLWCMRILSLLLLCNTYVPFPPISYRWSV